MSLDTTKNVFDGLSVTTLIGYYVGALPTVATTLTVIWTVLRIYEMPSVQKLLGRTPRVDSKE